MEPFGGIAAGTPLGPLEVTISAEANERYWRAAGLDHPLLRAGALYPPIAGNLTIQLLHTAAPSPIVHTRQRVVSHRRADAGTPLIVTGRVAERYERKGREYVVVEATVAEATTGEPVWSATGTFFELVPGIW